ncbi:hypothetical protein JCGZ_23603 [Jatropha curcas]|uniref:CHHC U11-48K-type domain-containing protein n=1 Tax=Jatropha curcas TaxID=180498 RepID=A0A067JUW6_JATCU|nr:hypothetical protein JCGZ_23603 [Jatropha curcas]
MNPSSTAYPNQYLFPYPPQHPNPNPIPNFFFSAVHQPPPRELPPAPATPTLDLSTTLSSLTGLLSLSQQTLSSLSSLLSPQTTSLKSQNANFVACPHNPHHLMPPEFLCLLSLRCPSPLFDDPTSLIDSLHYPKTVKLQTPPKSPFTESIQDSNTELCFSLDSFYYEFGSNFFYKDCPGVVNSTDLDDSNKTFTLPGVLSVECANFVGSGEGDNKGFVKNGFKILPSDLWAIRREVEGWVEYPSMYSYGVFGVILQLNVIRGTDLRRWLIAHSPHYGVVIDVYMGDHISVLFKLCLKAIRREALSLVDHEVNMKTSSYNCPVLGQVLMWIASHLSGLYGEVNAKCFAIHIFRQCVLEVANGILFPWESNSKEESIDSDDNASDIRDLKLNEPLERRIDCEGGTKVAESVDGEVIFVSQVAASVAALHERTLLEAKFIKCGNMCVLKGSVVRYILTCRVAEHEYMSKRAEEERQKRPNYRAIVEHDGLPSKQSNNQETSKTKTRQELLAEERDYKRRRMSYRGKKLKRTTLQVMWDIIDEYMEEIKQAGGIGCFEKEAEEERMSHKPSSASNIDMDVDEFREGNRKSKSSEAIIATSKYYEKQSQPDHSLRSIKAKDTSPQYYARQERSHDRYREHVEYQRNTCQGRHVRDYYSESPERHRSHGLLHEQSSRQTEQDDSEVTNKHCDKRSSSKSSYQNKSSQYLSHSANNSGRQKDDEKLDVMDRHLRSSYENHSSKFLAKNAFEDRYDPAVSNDTNQDDVYANKKYVRAEKFHK